MTAWIKQHPYATGAIVIVGGIILYMLSRSSGGSAASSSGGTAAQIAQTEAAQNVQNAQLQAQVDAAQINANAQVSAQNAQLQANQDTIVGQVAQTALQAETQMQGQGLQADVYKEMLSTAEQEQLSNNALTEKLGTQAETLIKSKGTTAGLNALALVLGQGNVGSYNEANASTEIAQLGLINSLTKTGSNMLSGLL